MAKQVIKKGSMKGKVDLPSEKPFHNTLLKIILGLLVGYIHQLHVSSLLESDRHFSHLSTLEREMSFRTEMGLYYSYFKNIVDAPSFLLGVESLYNNNLTEYPDTINTLQRFNLYPEIILGGAFRIYSDLANSMNWKTKECWKINRGENLSPVWSCEGIGDPAYFYLNGVWICAAMTMFFIFFLAAELSNSIIGGLFAVLCFFFNHGECTRVQWTPPLRESFAYPMCVSQMFLITYILKRNKMLSSYILVTMLSVTTMAYMAFWQFAQFALFTQVCSLFPVYALGLMNKETFTIILGGQMGGLLLSLALLFLNKMLMTSWLSCSLFASTAVIYSGEIFTKFRDLLSKEPKSKTSEKSKDSFQQPGFKKRILNAGLETVAFLGLTIVFKISAGKALNVKDDDHIFNLLRSKFSSYRDFHTMLYTCAREFDFLGWEMPWKGTQTFLIPAVVLVLVVLLVNSMKKGENSDGDIQMDGLTYLDPAIAYNFLQFCAFGVMAALIMRLKMFFVPQLCILAAMVANKKFIPLLRSNQTWQYAFIAGLVAVMSFQGVANIKQQRSIVGEYSNVEFEELIEWINATLPEDAAFAGPMPVMANILLSTRRPVTNHPHYEDVGIRDRTKKIYQMYSRRTPKEYYKTIKNLKAGYLVVSKGWCFNIHMQNKCGMTDMWDYEEPDRISTHEPLCPKLFNDHTAIRPFETIFKNNEYVVLRIPDNTPPKKGYSSKSKPL